MTLTAWWELLTASLENLHLRFPGAYFSHSPLFLAVSQIAMHGVKLEGYDNSIKGLLAIQKTSNAILREEDTLGKEVEGVNRTPNHIPKIIVPIDALIAIAYYEHLVRYDGVTSTRAILNDGVWLNPGIQARKPLISKHACILKSDIVNFFENHKNVLALLEIHPAFEQLFILTDPQEKFRAFSDLALGRSPLTHPLGKTFEEKLGERLEAEFLEAAAELDPLNAREQLSQKADETVAVLESIRTCKHELDVVDNNTDAAVRDMTYATLEHAVAKLNHANDDEVKFHASDLETRSDSDLKCLVNKAKLLARILKMGEHLSEFTQIHHTWFTRKLHFIFTWFREQDSYFLKTFFVPDTWKLIHEAEKLKNEMILLEKRLSTHSFVDTNEVEDEFRIKLMDTKNSLLSIHRESLFFLPNAEIARKQLEKKIEDGYMPRAVY